MGRMVKMMAVLVGLLVFSSASIAGVIESTFMRVGISPFGSLFYYADTPIYSGGSYYYIPYTSGGTGIVRKSDSWSPYRNWFPLEFWSITASTTGTPFSEAFFAQSYPQASAYSGFNTSWSSTTGTDTASVTGTTTFLLKVTHDFSFAAPNILAIDGTVTNLASSATPADVIYKRGINWTLGTSMYGDSAFAPAITPGSQLVDSTYRAVSYGTSPVNSFGAVSCASGCVYNYSSAMQYDVGAAMRLNLGTLGAGESATFRLYYGISQPGQTTAQLVSQLQALGASYWIVAHNADNTKSAIMGYGLTSGDVVPEPSTVATWATAASALGAALVRRRRQMSKGAASQPVAAPRSQ